MGSTSSGWLPEPAGVTTFAFSTVPPSPGMSTNRTAGAAWAEGASPTTAPATSAAETVPTAQVRRGLRAGAMVTPDACQCESDPTVMGCGYLK